MIPLKTAYFSKWAVFYSSFKSNVRETWRVILVSEADIFLSESLRILAERLSQSEIGLPLRQICYYSPPKEVGVFSTEIKFAYRAIWRFKASKLSVLITCSIRHASSAATSGETPSRSSHEESNKCRS